MLGTAMLFHHNCLNERMWVILAAWLHEVALTFRLHDETFHRAIAICLHYLRASDDMQRSRFQLLGAASLAAACKLHEIHPPKLSDFVYICSDAYTIDELRTFEYELLKLYALHPTAWQILASKCKSAHRRRAFYLADVATMCFTIISMPPGDVAVACELLARIYTKRSTRNDWRMYSESYIATKLMLICTPEADVYIHKHSRSLREKYTDDDEIIIGFPPAGLLDCHKVSR
jgi:hypothetical protein